MNIYYIYFVPSQHLSNGENLYNKFAMILADNPDRAKEKAKKHFPGVKFYITQDVTTKSAFGLKPIELDYLTKNNISLI